MSCHHQSEGSIPRQRWVFLQHEVAQITIIIYINYKFLQSEIEVAGEVQTYLTDELFTPPRNRTLHQTLLSSIADLSGRAMTPSGFLLFSLP